MSLEMIHLLCGDARRQNVMMAVGRETHLVERDLEEHIPRSLDAKEFSSNEDEVLLGQQRRILRPEYARERCRKVDVGPRILVDRLDDAALPPRDDVV